MPDLTPSDSAVALARLRSTHLFGNLAEEGLRALAAACKHRTLAAGEVLLRQGEPGEEMYLVLDGTLRVTRRDGADEIVLGEVRRGEHVGEIALLEQKPRSATITSLTPCSLLALGRSDFDAFLAGHPEVREELMALLRERTRWASVRRVRPPREVVVSTLAGFLGGVGEAVLKAIEGEVEWVTLPRGAVLLRQGEAGDCLYFIVSGRLRIYGQGEGGAEVGIAELGPGGTVDEMALLGGQPRSASAAAAIDSELLRLSKAGFEALLAHQPQAMALFTRVLLDRLATNTRARAAIKQLRSAPLATAAECEEIARTPNLVLRNLKITQMYHRLSQELTLLLGHEDANWCTFACNASKTAGYSIRREELPFAELIALALRPAWVRSTGAQLGSWLEDAPVVNRARAALDAVSATISAGNLKVFAEVAPIFARFVLAFHDSAEYDRAKLEAHLETIRPGPTEAGGQQLMREALGHYYEAAFETRAKTKAELILLGNVKVGLHEQTRLQPNIVDALNAPLTVGLDGIISSELARVGLMPKRLAAFGRTALGAVERRLARNLTDVWRKVVTRNMMTLRLPYGNVRLGADVPRLPDDQMFPDVLRELTHQDLIQLVHRFDDDPSSLSGSQASDWGNLEDRMNFILDLFRSRQRSLELFGQPFDHEQRAQMAGNQVPIGRL
jgi:CRP-like cAMP-binding protein